MSATRCACETCEACLELALGGDLPVCAICEGAPVRVDDEGAWLCARCVAWLDSRAETDRWIQQALAGQWMAV